MTEQSTQLDSRTFRWRRWTDPRGAVLRTVGRHAIIMGVVYAVTLGIAMTAAQLVTM